MIRLRSKSLERVDAGDARLEQRLGVGGGDDAADHHRDVEPLLTQQPHGLGDQLAVGAGEDREADHVDVLVARRGGDLLGRQADALVDHLHADVAGADGDLLGAVRVPVEARLADQDARPVAEPLGQLADPRAGGRKQLAVAALGGGRDPGRGAVVAEHVTQDARPLARGGARLRRLDRRRHDVRRLVARDLGELRQGPVDGGLVALGLPALERLHALALDLGVGRQDAAVGAGGQRRVLGLGEAVLAHDLDLAALDLGHPLAVRLDQPRLHVRHRLDRAAVLLDGRHLLPRALGQLLDQAVHHPRALEDVGIVEQVGLVGEDLLDPQAPLLVPRPRQAERLVPGRAAGSPGPARRGPW